MDASGGAARTRGGHRSGTCGALSLQTCLSAGKPAGRRHDVQLVTERLVLHPDRLFPSDERTREIARSLYQDVKDLPIVSPHGHTDPAWFALNEPFTDPANLLIVPDHYIFRVLYSQGIQLEQLGIPRVDDGPTESDPRAIWRIFAEHYHLFRGTPSRLWLDWVFAEVFDLDVRL